MVVRGQMKDHACASKWGKGDDNTVSLLGEPYLLGREGDYDFFCLFIWVRMRIWLSSLESDENEENEEISFLISDIRPPFVESSLDNKEIRRGIFLFFFW